MMTTHAMAMVKWNVFRPGGEGGVAVYDYGSGKKRLVGTVGGGGTLWLVTSRKRSGQPRSYHLAYKLVDCVQIPRETSIFSGAWPHVVRARDRAGSVHFHYNDATDTLRRLTFTSGRPMAQVDNIGLRLLSIPELTPGDADLMERFEHKVLHGRTGFLSYSHRNSVVAARLERELEKRDVHINRDVTFLRAGEAWREALAREVKSTDCFIVLISAEAAQSRWVRREVDWALSEYGGLVRAIIPLVVRGGGWSRFPRLHRFHRVDVPASPGAAFYDKLAADVASVRASGTPRRA